MAVGRESVLFVQTADNPVLGADAWVLLRIIEHLDRRRYDVLVACKRGPEPHGTPVWAEAARLDHVRLLEADLGPELSPTSGVERARAIVRTARAFVTLGRLAVRIRRDGIRIVHAGDRPRDALAAVVLARLTGAVSVVHVHQVYSEWWTRLLRWSVGRADVVVPVSEFVAESLERGGIDGRRIRPVLNALHLDDWVPTDSRLPARKALGLDGDAPIVLTVCRLFPEKGVTELLRAFAGVRRRVPGAVLLIAGDDTMPGRPYAAELVRLAEELGIAEAVRFLGRRDDVARLMAAADVFALPSHAEPFGLVYLEAMAMRLPTVALAVGGPTEIIRHGETGLLAAPDDLRELEDDLVELLESPERSADMGRRGRAVVEATFTTERQAAAMAQVYDDALSEPGHGLRRHLRRRRSVGTR